ncbi:CsbD family protein [Carnobacterium maltaromaticum]|uniref:CsbD family protein n=1 Tax=Carnobacterium TaxID=2747 RepID=UPI00298A6081|nr:CsbD family protein [Carnobacterium maltaromaticum]MDW5525187.1 CsbD family protein [Carnobacterium maltaromaticum]
MTDSGNIDKIKGKAKEVTGKATGDKGTQAEGLIDQVVGKVKEVASDAKDNAEDLIEDVKEKFDKK